MPVNRVYFFLRNLLYLIIPRFPPHTITKKNKEDSPIKETKPNTPAEFSVQSQDISDEELDTVAGGVIIEGKDALEIPPISPAVARVYF